MAMILPVPFWARWRTRLGKPLFESSPIIPNIRRPGVAYLHAYNARRGRYSCCVDRA
jgi:hypothetical protein